VKLTQIALSEPRPPGSGAHHDPVDAVLALVLGRCADPSFGIFAKAIRYREKERGLKTRSTG